MQLNYLAPSWELIDPNWQKFLKTKCSGQLVNLDHQLSEIKNLNKTIYPAQINTLRALSLAPQQVKVVILGQDPYHGENEAIGLSFAVNSGVKFPPTLRNIFKELTLEYHPESTTSYKTVALETWFTQGVLLLNSTLTVLKDDANSLAHIGWQAITDQIIHHLSEQNENLVFILWGNFARSKKPLINAEKHLVLESVHPSPLSANRGFFGCNHFKLTNQYLQDNRIEPINWLGE
jgi:uracil-DNA glycosylase